MSGFYIEMIKQPNLEMKLSQFKIANDYVPQFVIVSVLPATFLSPSIM